MSVLSEVDLELLRRGKAYPCVKPGCPCMDMQRQLADLLRQTAPEVADDQLALIALRMSGAVAHFAFQHGLHGAQVGGLLLGAAIDLAALEIGEIPQ